MTATHLLQPAHCAAHKGAPGHEPPFELVSDDKIPESTQHGPNSRLLLCYTKALLSGLLRDQSFNFRQHGSLVLGRIVRAYCFKDFVYCFHKFGRDQ